MSHDDAPISPGHTWNAPVVPGRQYHIHLSAVGPTRPRADTLAAAAVVEWIEPGKDNPLHRGYLLPDAEGWHGRLAAPEQARDVRVALYFWTQIAPAPEGVEWRCVIDDAGVAPTPQRVKLAVAHQATAQPPTLESNLTLTLRSIREAGEQGVKLLCMSENFLGRNIPLPLRRRSMAMDDPAIDAIRAAVAEAKLYATFSFIERTPEGRLHVTAPLIDPAGRIVGAYRKQYLTQMELESGMSPGYESPVFDTSLGRIAVNVCYDFWYPETALGVACRGADFICHPLAGDGIPSHWDHGWRARAIDHQCHVLSSVTHDCGGKTPSRIVAPDGGILAETWTPNALAIAETTLPWKQETFWFSVGPSMSIVRNVMDGTRAMFAHARSLHDP